MFARLGKTLVAVALAVMLGTHWMLLQSVAWMGMIVSYSQHASFKQAVVETFDGQHPCCLCRAIAAAKKKEKQSELVQQSRKLEFLPASENPALIAPSNFQLLSLRPNSAMKSLLWRPPTPPPRRFFA